jgi:hypothetical protein
MPFKVQVASIDLIGQTANVVAFDQIIPPVPGPAASINLTIPFTPAGGPDERGKLIAAAKAALQRAQNEI